MKDIENIDLEVEVNITDGDKKTLVSILNRVLGYAGRDEQLDAVASLIRDSGFWAYRGGCHVAVHYKKLGDCSKPEPGRIAIYQ